MDYGMQRNEKKTEAQRPRLDVPAIKMITLSESESLTAIFGVFLVPGIVDVASAGMICNLVTLFLNAYELLLAGAKLKHDLRDESSVFS